MNISVQDKHAGREYVSRWQELQTALMGIRTVTLRRLCFRLSNVSFATTPLCTTSLPAFPWFLGVREGLFTNSWLFVEHFQRGEQ